MIDAATSSARVLAGLPGGVGVGVGVDVTRSEQVTNASVRGAGGCSCVIAGLLRAMGGCSPGGGQRACCRFRVASMRAGR